MIVTLDPEIRPQSTIMFSTIVSRAATALLLGSHFVAAIDVNLDDACMAFPNPSTPLMVIADFDSSVDPECRGNDRVRHDDLLQGKCIWRNNRSLAWSSSKPDVGMLVLAMFPGSYPALILYRLLVGIRCDVGDFNRLLALHWRFFLQRCYGGCDTMADWDE